ncbi:MAG: hypothetical protein SFU85_11290 [Candidatus Methylacidiphilales bacterium]|nr:hypothetical protein [Candidatus Methylacidiphilales bacterium]
MSLLSEIQEVLERTYSPSGINLEQCLIGGRRSAELAALCPGAGALTPVARTYLRTSADNLYIGIYYDPSLIRCLEEEDPRESISHRNVVAFIQFIEEITHGVHAALAFRAGWRRWDSEQFACALEAQARVDTYFLLVRFCRLLGGGPISTETRDWIWERLYGDESDGGGDGRVERRYRLARGLAGRFVAAVRRHPRRERVLLIRRFRGPGLAEKLRLVRSLEK